MCCLFYIHVATAAAAIVVVVQRYQNYSAVVIMILPTTIELIVLAYVNSYFHVTYRIPYKTTVWARE